MIKNKKNLIKNLCIILAVVIIIFLIYKSTIIRETLIVLLSSFILAYSIKPIYRKILSKVDINKRLLAFLLIIGVILLFMGSIAIFIPGLLTESISLESLIAGLEEIVSTITSKINIRKEELYAIINEQFGERINIIIAGFTDRIFNWVIEFSENILALAIVPIIAYYFLADGDLIANKLLLLFSSDKRILIKKIARDIDKVLGKYIVGQLFLCVIVGLMTFAGLMIIDIKFILILSLLNGILNIVPYFGAAIGAIPAMIIALLDEPIKMLYVLIMFIIIQQLEGNVIAPKITANSIKMHPLMVIILLLIGEKLFGLIGMILVVPLGVVIKIIYEDVNYYLF
ncbi:AI-2E family transporter [Clostridium mediterraneense]|uniref:AI-2E family transporter n=1 Tax=Clostridium mediterraneense TaxID=1805472 RepID=UPI000834E958|nr:AI-2E family transporter [Clostridium mediterraneense]